MSSSASPPPKSFFRKLLTRPTFPLRRSTAGGSSSNLNDHTIVPIIPSNDVAAFEKVWLEIHVGCGALRHTRSARNLKLNQTNPCSASGRSHRTRRKTNLEGDQAYPRSHSPESDPGLSLARIGSNSSRVSELLQLVLPTSLQLVERTVLIMDIIAG
jgi:hypothetical protein